MSQRILPWVAGESQLVATQVVRTLGVLYSPGCRFGAMLPLQSVPASHCLAPVIWYQLAVVTILTGTCRLLAHDFGLILLASLCLRFALPLVLGLKLLLLLVGNYVCSATIPPTAL